MSLPYDHTDPKSIEAYAKQLLGKALSDVLDPSDVEEISLNLMGRGGMGRGRLGQILEKYYFKYEPNNESEPDFPEACLELKSTPVLYTNNGQLRPKERLVLNIIDFMTEHKKEWKDSSFWRKNKSLLLLFYLHIADVPVVDLVFKLGGIWEYPPADLKIIKEDWNKIVNKIREGKAHEISEGDTFYLGACRKGSGGKRDLRDQPFSNEKAFQRAYSLKTKYMRTIIGQWSGQVAQQDFERIMDSTVPDEEKTFEQLVIERVEPFIGKPISAIHKELNVDANPGAKNYYSIVTLRMLGVRAKYAEEFEKADVVVKTIRLKRSGMPKEDISFPYFKYKELVIEDWDSSTFKEMLEKRFFLVVYQYNENDELILRKAMFWAIPHDDLLEVKQVWNRTVKLIKDGQADYLPRKSESPVCHVRPHARNTEDTDETPEGRYIVKKSFWLNAGYIKEQLERGE